ncbi:TIGR03915 family putative DNA repair protein [Gillisia sp. M10.2A]|uniref:TIGR03915 family putative DNA repair protein n=1 Tax=Gillisia lutea TaxID=2909668 RepID=A0ABS9EGC3_9FLAO|nr:TIGR03915 family putative DNA repair protein [Gillisia lutea]MCF4101935.1 TIGR03915 family putative DNA repair protein [Gillisia lutea]
MNTSVIISYDGSFDGFLCVVFASFEQHLQISAIHPEIELQQDFFSAPLLILTEEAKANRVKTGLTKCMSATSRRKLYWAFLSELPGIELTLLQYVQMAFKESKFRGTDFGDSVILRVTQVAKMVSREKHRMEAFIRFKLTKDDIYFAGIEPDFNVLPLISKHFETRYADQKWIIYDYKRKFGLYYDLENVVQIHLEFSEDIKDHAHNPKFYDTSELEFQKLWQHYFSSTNIKSRKNLKLHLQHVPKRYWKYLTEKSSLLN